MPVTLKIPPVFQFRPVWLLTNTTAWSAVLVLLLALMTDAQALDLAQCNEAHGSAYLITTPESGKGKEGWQPDQGSNSLILSHNAGFYDIRSLGADGLPRIASKRGKVSLVNKLKNSILITVSTANSPETYLFTTTPSGEMKFLMTRTTNLNTVTGSGVYFGTCRFLMIR
jgi:hypothetical protein